jgi:hypothetical protein
MYSWPQQPDPPQSGTCQLHTMCRHYDLQQSNGQVMLMNARVTREQIIMNIHKHDMTGIAPQFQKDCLGSDLLHDVFHYSYSRHSCFLLFPGRLSIFSLFVFALVPLSLSLSDFDHSLYRRRSPSDKVIRYLSSSLLPFSNIEYTARLGSTPRTHTLSLSHRKREWERENEREREERESLHKGRRTEVRWRKERARERERERESE